MAATEEVIDSLDALHSKITAVRAENGNRLVFSFPDGNEVVKLWQDRSRRQSWTSEMKDAARQKTMERRAYQNAC